MSYSFVTHPGLASHELIPVQTYSPPNGSYVAEFSHNAHFDHPVVAGTVTYTNGEFALDLTPDEVTGVGSGSFRIVLLSGKARTYVANGTISMANPGLSPDSPKVSDYNFVSQTYVDNQVQGHIHSAEPHPAYDDLPQLTLLFENGMM